MDQTPHPDRQPAPPGDDHRPARAAPVGATGTDAWGRLAAAAFRLTGPVIRQVEAERAHELSLKAAARLPATARLPRIDPRLAMRVGALCVRGPVGLAAGFDKDAVAAHALGHFGFGAIEVGTLTPRPQDGNPVPRLFRLPADRAVINRLGFNNQGQDAALRRLRRLPPPGARGVPVGVNIGANKDAGDRAADYAAGTTRMAAVADYLTVNISSPNTPGLRALQDPGHLVALLAAVIAARDAVAAGIGRRVPVWLKIAPDLDDAAIDAIVRIAIDAGVAALIVSNTTINRPALTDAHAAEAGGLSGAPLGPMALDRLRRARAASGGTIALVAAGGIADADAAFARIRAGASLVQLYTGLVYGGPGLVARLNRGLIDRVERAGLASLADAVGLDA